MVIQYLIKPSHYRDSVTLMEVARELTQLPAVDDAAVVMASDANKALLRQANLFLPALEATSANDLIIVVRADSPTIAGQALAAADKRLARQPQDGRSASGDGRGWATRTIRQAVRTNPRANLAVISVAGPYAAAEAWEALHNNLHVLMFSDNVPIEDEIALKRYAADHGLLMMGPDCGTAILNGVALGFANAVPRGPVGIVAAAGTGLQEASTLLAKRGIGISQGIGTGGRDLKEAVGGLTMLAGIQALQADPETQVLLLISKPPAPSVAQRILAQIKQSDKPTVVCFLGGDPAPIAAAGAIPAITLQTAAYLAAAQVQGHSAASVDNLIKQETRALQAQATGLKSGLSASQRYLRGLFSGGTLAAEALLIWNAQIGEVWSNVALQPDQMLKDPTTSQAHCAVDLGEDVFTVGRPHPMIDHDLRIRRLLQEAADPEVAVIMLDVVLGYGAHPDPAGGLSPAIRQAIAEASKQGRTLTVIAAVTGVDSDPQNLSQQVKTLQEAGVVIASCNAAAARLAGFIVAPD